jgi:hypothetical protein
MVDSPNPDLLPGTLYMMILRAIHLCPWQCGSTKRGSELRIAVRVYRLLLHTGFGIPEVNRLDGIHPS